MSAPHPNTAGALIGIAALACGVAAASSIQPEKLIDFSINKTSNLVTSLNYAADNAAEGNPRRGFLQSKLRGLSAFVDENALALEWKVKLMDFDERSPVKSNQIVQCIVGIAVFLATKRVLGIAAR